MRYNTNQVNINFNELQILASEDVTSGEFFAGGGGWSEGMQSVPGITLKWLLNHDKVAIKTNSFHHPQVKVYWADIYAQDEHELEYVDHIHASIECKYHSKANAQKEKKIGSYMMGWELYRYIKYLQPILLTIENVPEFKKWAPVDESGHPIKSQMGEEFERWKKAFIDLGYEYSESIRNAADDGMPTSRVRYFGAFYRPGVEFIWPSFTHSETAKNGLKRWVACKDHIDLEDEGYSIFGREYNQDLPTHLRKPLCDNSLRRIGFGALRYSDEFRQFIAHYYGCVKGARSQSIEKPINTIPTENRHQLITLEKIKFIADHCRVAQYNEIERPLKTQTTRQTKQLISVDHFVCQYYGKLQAQDLELPINTIPCRDVHQLIRLEKFQFIAKYMNSNGNPEYNTQLLEDPLSVIMTENKHQLITILDGFDIKARFLSPKELAACSTFPRDYFSKPGLKISAKDAVKMIGNAVPPKWAELIMGANVKAIKSYKNDQSKSKVA